MKEEDLINKLENVELPDINLQGHQRRLRMALLDAGYLKRQREDTILELVKFKIKGVKDTMIRGLISQQPVWKTATFAVVAVALVIGLSLTIPSLTTESVYAQAEEIAMNSASVKEALGGGEIQVIEINITDDTGTVIAKGEAGFVSAELDLNTNSVIDVATFVVDEQAAIDIAKADPKVKELLDAGATMGDVSTMCISGAMGNVATGETEYFSEAYITLELTDSENIYTIRVDMREGKVVDLTEISLDAISNEPPGPATVTFSIPDSETDFYIEEKVIEDPVIYN